MRGNGLLREGDGAACSSGPLRGQAGVGPERLAGGVELLYQAWNKNGTFLEAAVETRGKMPAAREELLALEQQLECEWWWLHGALNAVAELQVGRPSADQTMLRNLQALARDIDRRRVALSVQIAKRQGPDRP
jgi:hypothetical protein